MTRLKEEAEKLIKLHPAQIIYIYNIFKVKLIHLSKDHGNSADATRYGLMGLMMSLGIFESQTRS